MPPALDHDELCNSTKRNFFDVSSEDVCEEVSKKARAISDDAEVIVDLPRIASVDLRLTTLHNLPHYGGPRKVPSPPTDLDKRRTTLVDLRENSPYCISPDTSVVNLVAFVPQGETVILEKEKGLGNAIGTHRANSFDSEELEILQDWELDTMVTTPQARSSETAPSPCSPSTDPQKYEISLSGRRACLMEHKRRKSIWGAALVLLMMALLGYSPPTSNSVVEPNSVYVSGGGFSGFWFSIGRLQSIPNPASKTYYCYSAGCLAVFAALSNSTIDQMSDLCFGVQRRWQTGKIKHYDVVTDFLDHFLATSNMQQLLENQELLSNVRVITAVRNGWYGLKSAIRSPTGYSDLHTMLLQTTWIPFATGERMWEVNASPEGEYHMDGIFSPHDHPVCAHKVGLPWHWDLRINALNVNLSEEQVAKFWNQGLAYGL